MEKISVAVRVRPPIKQEPQKGSQWRVGGKSIALYNAITSSVPIQSFVFDHVFGSQAKNADLYEIHIKEVIMSAVKGFNGTVFAYGQTSSGKTYTMQGSSLDPGIIHLAVRDVFSTISSIVGREFLIRVSYLEIYNEEINDLLAPENRKLRMHENLERGIYVAGLREEIVNTPEQVLEFLAFGDEHRHFGDTSMNLHSSRSHSIFRMVIESRSKYTDSQTSSDNSDAVRVSTLSMVDLAGSERVSKTGSGGVRLKEGTHINKSLMTLGTVINKLSEGAGKNGGHIPFRDSKLTRILQPALGGNAKTAIICTITPDEIHLDESRGTLQFANRANKVTTCAQVNEILTDAALLKRQMREIEDLRQKLQGSQSGDLEQEILNLRNDLLKYELDKDRLALELEEEKKAQLECERRIKEQEQKIENLSTLVVSSARDDRDRAKLAKKKSRRETWCPQQLSSGFVTETIDIQRHAETDLDALFDKSLVSVRGEMPLAPLPEFDSLFDEEANTFWSTSIKLEDQIGKADDSFLLSSFGNIADEDTWLSLNKGHSSFDFSNHESHHSASSAGSAETNRVAMLSFQLNELQLQHEELQACYNLKEIEAARNKEQYISIFQENLMLKDKFVHELVLQQKMEKTLADLVKEVNSVKALTDSLEGFLIDCQNFQSLIISDLKEFVSEAQVLRKLDKDDCVLSFQCNMGAQTKELILEDGQVACQSRMAEEKEFTQKKLISRNAILESAPGTSDEDYHTQRNEGHLLDDLMMEIDCNTSISQKDAICDETLLENLKQMEKVILQREENKKCIQEAGYKTLKPHENQFCKGCLSFINNEDNMGCSQKAFVTHDGKPFAAVNVKVVPDINSFEQLPMQDLESVLGSHICACNGLNQTTRVSKEDDLQSQEPLESTAIVGSVIYRNILAVENMLSPDVRFLEKKQDFAMIPKKSDNLVMSNNAKIHTGKCTESRSKATRAQILTKQFLQEFCRLLEHNVTTLQEDESHRATVWRLIKVLQELVLHCYRITITVENGGFPKDMNEEDANLVANGENFESTPMQDSGISCMTGSLKSDHSCHYKSTELDMLSSEIKSDCSSSYIYNEKVPRTKGKLLHALWWDRRSSSGCQFFHEAGKCKDEISLHDFNAPTTGLLERDPSINGSLEIVASGAEDRASKEAAGYLKMEQRFGLCENDDTSSSLDFDIPRTKKECCLLERLQMSQEHISTLEQQLAISNLEKQRIKLALHEQTNKDEDTVIATRIEKLRLASDMNKCIGEIAVHDETLSALCFEIEDFEKLMMPNVGVMHFGFQGGLEIKTRETLDHANSVG